MAALWGCSKHDEAPTGEVSVESSWAAILLSAVDVIVGRPLPHHDHYQNFFAWRFKTVPPYRDIYLRLASGLEKRSLQETGKSFVSGTLETRARVMADVFDHDPNPTELDTHFRSEALALFARTDARIFLGYDSWPGVANGLDALQRPAGKGA
jgi:hypothetical protein